MRPLPNQTAWFMKYARGCLALKKNHRVSAQEADSAAKAIREAFTRVYRAVAFDIDGTLTREGGIEVEIPMVLVVGRLLQRGVPVILITGRGRTSTRSIAQAIRQHSSLSDWYLRRLQCVTHNGVFLLRTPTENPGAFLSLEETIGQGSTAIQDLVKKVEEAVRNMGAAVSSPHISKEPHSIRITLRSADDRAKVERVIRKSVLQSLRGASRAYLCRGAYGQLFSLDLSWTNKKLALDKIACRMGIDPTKILRIGDQGQAGGNDFDLLNSPSGFSVGEFSDDTARCHPVLAPDFRKRLIGARATNRLLRLVLLFPSLSIAPTPEAERLTALRSFERLAIIRSHQETETVTQRLRVRLRYLLPENVTFPDPRALAITDIYDELSGGVKFRDWELDCLSDDHPARELFEIGRLQRNRNDVPGASWCMYTDTGILMRGPNYYFGLAEPAKRRTIRRYIDLVTPFIDGSTQTLNALASEQPDLTRFKLVLAIQDNVRNILLQLLYATFTLDGLEKHRTYKLTRKFYDQTLLPHTKQHFGFLLSFELDWVRSLRAYQHFVRKLRSSIQVLYTMNAAGKASTTKEHDLFKWRECDHFLQNVAAVQLGLHEIRQRPEVRDLRKLTALGLAYGGLELPGLAQAIAATQGVRIDAAVAKVSIYGSRATGRQIRAGNYDYVTKFLLKTRPLCLMRNDGNIEKTPVILMDDNCTTCVTLQLARDFIVRLNGDVIGATVIRFPGVNRHVQMAMPGHGFPDPEVLFSFVRGLIAPSPYSRLIFPSPEGNPYLDQTKVFDKAKERIIRYLKKNGTYRLRGK